MTGLKRRIEKVENKVRSMEKEANESKARLLEMQKVGKDNSLQGLLLQLELKYGRKLSIIDAIALALAQKSEDYNRIRNDKTQQKPTKYSKNQAHSPTAQGHSHNRNKSHI